MELIEVKFTIKSVYGNDLVYPVCPLAKALTALGRKTTLTHDMQSIIQKDMPMFKIVFVAPWEVGK